MPANNEIIIGVLAFAGAAFVPACLITMRLHYRRLLCDQIRHEQKLHRKDVHDLCDRIMAQQDRIASLENKLNEEREKNA